MPCELGCESCGSLRRAALELIGEGGGEALSSERLASRAGVSVEQVHAHYATPELCLYDTYAEVSRSVLGDFAEAFAAGSSWPQALRLAGRRLLDRMAQRPAEARLCFLEVQRGDRELRRLREQGRRRMVALFVAEHRRRRQAEELPDMQLELLIGAGFQAIAGAVSQGRVSELPQLEPALEELAGVFEPLAA
jgi:AcrR family transcriptional regulator